MKHISLFSGIGGFELAAVSARWQNVASCEIDDFCSKVLEYHFPEIYHHRDIKTLTYNILNDEVSKRFGADWRNEPVVLTGGFPCQPFSCAGRRKGADDDRYLWPEMLRVIREVKPAWVIGENVAGILSMVQPGEAIDMEDETAIYAQDYQVAILRQEHTTRIVCENLEQEGYSVQPIVIPACAVGAPHRRDRVWFIAHSDSDRQRIGPDQQIPLGGSVRTPDAHQRRKDGVASDAPSKRLQGDVQQETILRTESFQNFPTQSPVCRRNDGLSFNVDDLTVSFGKWREGSIKAYGNAIVPQVAHEIFKAINRYEEETKPL